MNFRELINKIEEAEAADPARAQYDKFKADDAKAAAVAQVKQMTKPNGNANFIDPKDGIIKYQENGAMGQPGGVKEFSYDWYKKGQEGQFFGLLKAAGLEVIPVEKKSLFGTYQVAGVDPAKLTTLGQDTAGGDQQSAQGAADDQAKATALAKLKQLNELLAKLKASKVKEGIDFEIAQQLIESFGYTQEQLDELSMQDVGDFGRGAWQGATLGTGNNIAAGAKSLFKGSKYKDELEAELAADKAAQDRSPNAYLGGNVAGAIGSSFAIPGAGLGNLAARGAAKLGAGAATQALTKGATMVGTNLALQKGIDTAVAAHNKDVLGDKGKTDVKPGQTDAKLAQLQKIIGAKPDGIMGPETQAKLQAWQEKQGLTADGIPGPQTYGKAGIKESAAEQYARLRDRLAMLESEQQIDEMPNLGAMWQAAKTGFNPAMKVATGATTKAGNPQTVGQTTKAFQKALAARPAAERGAYAVGKGADKVVGGAKAVGGAMARNPGKTALGTAAAAYGLSQLGGDANKVDPTNPNKPIVPNKQDQAGADTGTTQLDQATLDQINQLMSELSQFEYPEIQQGLVQARQTLSQITGDKNIGSADKPQASNATVNTTGGPNMGQVNKPEGL